MEYIKHSYRYGQLHQQELSINMEAMIHYDLYLLGLNTVKQLRAGSWNKQINIKI